MGIILLDYMLQKAGPAAQRSPHLCPTSMRGSKSRCTVHWEWGRLIFSPPPSSHAGKEALLYAGVAEELSRRLRQLPLLPPVAHATSSGHRLYLQWPTPPPAANASTSSGSRHLRRPPPLPPAAGATSDGHRLSLSLSLAVSAAFGDHGNYPSPPLPVSSAVQRSPPSLQAAATTSCGLTGDSGVPTGDSDDSTAGAHLLSGLRAVVAFRPASRGHMPVVSPSYFDCVPPLYPGHIRLSIVTSRPSSSSVDSEASTLSGHDDLISFATSSPLHLRAPPEAKSVAYIFVGFASSTEVPETGATRSLAARIVNQRTSDDLVNTGDNSPPGCTVHWERGRLVFSPPPSSHAGKEALLYADVTQEINRQLWQPPLLPLVARATSGGHCLYLQWPAPPSVATASTSSGPRHLRRPPPLPPAVAPPPAATTSLSLAVSAASAGHGNCPPSPLPALAPYSSHRRLS
ncbi:uncharacterized protein LOC121979590 [Zingiber officinale]|uniref:uncharacterized protein LOC121979590 n=1 Tax=Zingiber officinale TaxID=94328 RepID=UPI001C4DB379|nr:uncharacterized protein LOC121979590 [Zingiber officinale]